MAGAVGFHALGRLVVAPGPAHGTPLLAGLGRLIVPATVGRALAAPLVLPAATRPSTLALGPGLPVGLAFARGVGSGWFLAGPPASLLSLLPPQRILRVGGALG